VVEREHCNSLNVCSTTVLWTIWKARNDLLFSGIILTGSGEVARLVGMTDEELEAAEQAG
jgi:hypothetical protein